MLCTTTIARSRFLWLPAFALLFDGYPGTVTAAGDGDAKQRHSSPIVTPLAAEPASAGYLSNLTKNRLSTALEASCRAAGSQ